MSVAGRAGLAAAIVAAAAIATVVLPAGAGSRAAEQEARRVRVLQTIPKFRLTGTDGLKTGSKELDGKVWVATFVFTRCGNTCPAQMTEMARLQKDLAAHPRSADIRFVSFTVDPAHDTPEVLRAYGEQHGADPSRWVLLTGTSEEMMTISKVGFHLPIEADPNAEGIITHSQQFILVDRARRVRGYYDALDAKARAKLRQDLELVLDDPRGPIYYSKNIDRGRLEGNRAYVPFEIKEVPWMKQRAEEQAGTVDRFRVFHDFTFTDRQPQSGITFRHHIVDDAGKFYKGVHYDHGNGIAAADVDGDGRQDLYFVSQLGGNDLWRNKGDGTFENITEKAGVGVKDRVPVSASFADIDNDGDADLYVTAVRAGNLLFENDGHGVFRDITAASGAGYKGHSSAAVFFDYDRDGLVDLYVCNIGRYTTDQIGAGGYYVGLTDAFSGQLFPDRTEASVLYRNAGNNRFVDVSRQADVVDNGWSGAASPLDVNEDGWTDLYVLSMQGHDGYYENQQGRKFIERRADVFPEDPWGAMGVKSFDFDNDGDMDLYLTDMHTDMVDDFVEQAQRFWYAEKMKATETFSPRFLNTDGRHTLGNAFWLNEGEGRFREVSDEIGAETYWPWGLSTGDLNADGWQDVFLTAGMNYPYRYGINSLLLNNEGREFLDSEFILGVEPRREGRTNTFWFTLDCTKAPDNQHYACQQNKGIYEVYGALGTRSSVMLDLEGDGDLDIVTNDFNSEPMVLVSNLSERQRNLHWLQVRLVGSKANRGGLGARVRVTAGGQTWTQVNDGQSGYISQSAMPLYFGLGKARTVDRIEVRWPSARGAQVTEGPIKANQVLTLTEP